MINPPLEENLRWPRSSLGGDPRHAQESPLERAVQPGAHRRTCRAYLSRTDGGYNRNRRVKGTFAYDIPREEYRSIRGQPVVLCHALSELLESPRNRPL